MSPCSLYLARPRNPAFDRSLIHIPLHHGEATFKIPQEFVDQFFQPYNFTLVRKFSHGRLTLENLQLCFAKFNLKGNFQLGHLDNKHIKPPLSTPLPLLSILIIMQ